MTEKTVINKFIFYIFKQHKFKLLSVLVFSLFYNILCVYLTPYLLQLFIDNYNKYYINIIYISLYIISLSFFPLFSILSNKISLKTREIIKMDIIKYHFDRILEKDIPFFTNNFSGNLTYRFNKLTELFDGIMDKIIKIFSILLSFFIMFLLIYKIDFLFSLFIIFWLFIYVFFIKKLINICFIKTKILVNKNSKVIGNLNDCIVNISNIKSFTTEKMEINTIKNNINEIYQVKGEWNQSKRNLFLFNFFVINLFIFVVTAILFYFYKIDFIAFGKCIFLLQATLNIIVPFRANIEQLFAIVDDIAEFKSHLEILNKKSNINNKQDSTDLCLKEGKIIFNNIKFKY